MVQNWQGRMVVVKENSTILWERDTGAGFLGLETEQGSKRIIL